MTPSSLKTFVQNRTEEINNLTGDSTWLHVAGKQNPADLLTRGAHIDDLNSYDMWWHGPSFLRDPDLDSRENYVGHINYDELPEMKTNTTSLICQSNNTEWFPFERSSFFNRMRRAAAYTLRFMFNIRITDKKQRRTGPLTVEELNTSIKTLARLSQQQSFPIVYNALVNKRSIKLPPNISSLNIFLDKENLIRVGGRLSNSDTFTYDKKHPVLICGKHTFSKLLVRYQHRELLHAGPQLLLSTIRESWWPLKGRDLVKQAVHQCVKCTRMKGQSLQIQMGNLPYERIEPGYPFMRCGVDYAGPMLILNRKGRGAKLEKCYIL